MPQPYNLSDRGSLRGADFKQMQDPRAENRYRDSDHEYNRRGNRCRPYLMLTAIADGLEVHQFTAQPPRKIPETTSDVRAFAVVA
jgi:hypothetical protein